MEIAILGGMLTGIIPAAIILPCEYLYEHYYCICVECRKYIEKCQCQNSKSSKIYCRSCKNKPCECYPDDDDDGLLPEW